MTSVRPRQIYEDNKTYPILVKMAGYHRIVEMSGKQANKDNGMSGYNIDFAMSATLSAKVVEEMVRKVVEEQTGKKVDSIVFTIKSRSMGDQRDSWTDNVLDSCVVTFVADKAKTGYAGIYPPGTR